MSNEFIYGFHAVKTVLQTRPHDVKQLLTLTNRHDQRVTELTKIADTFHIPCAELSKIKLQELLGDVNHQGIVARCKPLAPWSEKELMHCVENTPKVLLLVLDGVQDPHNLGACLRSANAFGVHAVIAPKDHSASITDVVKKVACGAAEQTPFVAVSNLNRTLKQLKEANVWLVGFDSEATVALNEVDLKGNIAIVMGGEGEGLRRLTRETCDYLANIPMLGSVESLNVSVATGVALYEAQKQRGNA
ncbi:MAG TPA: 23S rRNA (guanosine(2251)-2'-O)-methyltransferase RlmB [Coxiellaceae bacterium]|nr:MAG: 23S rRNA (guanosine(2251)-2'-O)-methyltransferase RlmB [Gammaproteobacteria bacterium RIFCSPHIGHO2_12_FULL_36_30]HLB56951.1 23S rRNA (guanosine(2251)-2'-O)-methyltransferase RlmB [Coxiellaceae bacterium]